MKKYFFFIFLYALSVNAIAQEAKDFTLPIKVDAVDPRSGFVISWPLNENASSYTIKRKILTDKSFSDTFLPIASITQEAPYTKFYIDNNIETGLMYEYEIKGTFNNITPTTRNTYVCGGAKIPATHYRGTIILLCDNTITNSIEPELKQLYEDLVGDGWKVKRIDVPRSNNPLDVAVVKNKIISIYQQNPDTKELFIIGHVPVPYAGLIVPDGHTNHFGAWAADGYYGDVQNTWTDISANDISATRPENRNIREDGKFDQSNFVSVKLGVGRVDFYNLPTFPLSETALFKRYFAKDHAYKTASLKIIKQAIIEDNFPTYVERFSQGAWKSGAANVGYDNVKNAPYDTLAIAPSSDSYLWSYGCGSGAYESAWGISSTSDFSTHAYHGIFTAMFGSYFGDWDSPDNLMRASLASAGSILTCVWSGRPHWFFHPMSIGMPIGYCATLTMNNSGTYSNTGSNAGRVHTSLLGDPSLRNSYVPPPKALIKSTGNTSVLLSWTATTEPLPKGYNIYRSNSITGNFILLNADPVTNLFYEDTLPLTGKNVYMVRTVKLETVVSDGAYNNTSSYYNLSQAIIDSAVFLNIVLPVNLLSFSGKSNNCVNELTWKTATETNIKEYVVEFSISGNNFEKLVSLAATNLQSSKTYTYNHPTTNDNSFYRLKIIEHNGSFQYSPQVFLPASCSKEFVRIYPIPAANVLNIIISNPSMKGDNTAALYDFAGKLLQKIKIVNGINTINTSTLPKGAYNLTLSINGDMKNYQITK